jgi:hypothetical protein
VIVLLYPTEENPEYQPEKFWILFDSYGMKIYYRADDALFLLEVYPMFNGTKIVSNVRDASRLNS